MIKIFPHKSYTAKANGVRMWGSGKGAPKVAAPVKRGKVMFEIVLVYLKRSLAKRFVLLAKLQLNVNSQKREAE